MSVAAGVTLPRQRRDDGMGACVGGIHLVFGALSGAFRRQDGRRFYARRVPHRVRAAPAACARRDFSRTAMTLMPTAISRGAARRAARTRPHHRRRRGGGGPPPPPSRARGDGPTRRPPRRRRLMPARGRARAARGVLTRVGVRRPPRSSAAGAGRHHRRRGRGLWDADATSAPSPAAEKTAEWRGDAPRHDRGGARRSRRSQRARRRLDPGAALRGVVRATYVRGRCVARGAAAAARERRAEAIGAASIAAHWRGHRSAR